MKKLFAIFLSVLCIGCNMNNNISPEIPVTAIKYEVTAFHTELSSDSILNNVTFEVTRDKFVDAYLIMDDSVVGPMSNWFLATFEENQIDKKVFRLKITTMSPKLLKMYFHPRKAYLGVRWEDYYKVIDVSANLL